MQHEGSKTEGDANTTKAKSLHRKTIISISDLHHDLFAETNQATAKFNSRKQKIK